MHQKTALITGVEGQDGYYLTHLLLDKGYRVVGVTRRPVMERMGDLPAGVELRQADSLEQGVLLQLVDQVRPDEVYNLAGMSFIPASWLQPSLTADCNGLGVVRWLEAIRRKNPQARFFQASSSRMYGPRSGSPIHEESPFDPTCPYGSSKVFGHCAAVNYREGHQLFVSCGILFNHESPRRRPDFVSRKITRAAVRIASGSKHKLRLGNLDAVRDWSYAGDVVQAMWLALQSEEPEDYVIGSGELHTVAEFAEAAFGRVGLAWRDHVVVDPGLTRSDDPIGPAADAGKARRKLGWRPGVDFRRLVEIMVDADLERLEQQRGG